MSILVTGGAGYIGSHVILALHDIGLRPVVLDNLSTGSLDLVPSGVPFIQGDFSDEVIVRKTIREYKCDSVIHLGGSIISSESYERPVEYYQNNTVGSFVLFNTCIEENINYILYSSTAAVYGNTDGRLITEDAPLLPISPYGASKMMAERILSDVAAKSNINFGILRYFNVAGADENLRSGQVGPGSHLIKISAEVATGMRKNLIIHGSDYSTPDGTCIRDYIHVSDLAELHVLALDHLKGNKENFIVNCGYGAGFSVHEVVKAIERVGGKSLNVIMGKRRAGDVPVLVSNNDRIRSLLLWSPRYDRLDYVVKTALDWEIFRHKHS